MCTVLWRDFIELIHSIWIDVPFELIYRRASTSTSSSSFAIDDCGRWFEHRHEIRLLWQFVLHKLIANRSQWSSNKKCQFSIDLDAKHSHFEVQPCAKSTFWIWLFPFCGTLSLALTNTWNYALAHTFSHTINHPYQYSFCATERERERQKSRCIHHRVHRPFLVLTIFKSHWINDNFWLCVRSRRPHCNLNCYGFSRCFLQVCLWLFVIFVVVVVWNISSEDRAE